MIIFCLLCNKELEQLEGIYSTLFNQYFHRQCIDGLKDKHYIHAILSSMNKFTTEYEDKLIYFNIFSKIT